MTKPIAQSFYINESINGVEGVVLTKVELFFQSVSSEYGVELQIRTIEDGQPTLYKLPDASKILTTSQVYASADASVPTVFEFDTPIPLQSQTSYALVIIPVGGNPDYKIWTAELSALDVTTGTPIFTNNETGDLFLASNDRSFTPVITEDIKFNLYVANFTQSEGQAVYELDNFENIIYHSQTKAFQSKEAIYMSETDYNLARLTISSNTAAFINNETIYQSNGSANVATGKIYGANSTAILISNSAGSWSNAYQVAGATSSANAVVSLVFQDVISYSNTTVTVPFSNVFYANQMIYLATNDRFDMSVFKVTEVVDATTISIFSNAIFSDQNCLIGKVRGDNGLLFGFIDGPLVEQTEFLRNIATVGGSRANSTVNFANSTGCYIIGQQSKASAICYFTEDLVYNSVVPTYSIVESKSTGIKFSFTGVERYTYNYDASRTTLINDYETELTDKARTLMSRSNEYVSKSGNTTFRIYANLSSSSAKFSPVIGTYKRHVDFLRNVIIPESDLQGYILNLSNFNNFKNIEKLSITQNNGSFSVEGRVYFANTTILYAASNSQIGFQTGNTIYLSTNSSVNAVVTSSTKFNEIYNTLTNPAGSRYISKTVILADKQDAEDLVSYISAYRPAETNLIVYSKIVNGEDDESIKDKYWSPMIETADSKLLLSSGSNPNDFVELVYNFPTAVEIFANSVSCNTTSANITLATTDGINDYDYIYLYDETNRKFIVRQVSDVANNTTLIVNKTPTFASSNCKFGTIPGIQDATNAFIFPDNNYIVRYVSNTDVVYDGFKTFNIKIVPVSNSSHLVPRADDMRCLALQV
jgi:hypothetical protein